MSRMFRRSSVLALATVFATVVGTTLFAPSASAAENTWIRTRPGPEQRPCLDATPIELGPGRWQVQGISNCMGDGLLWDRRGASVYRAYSNQCLDSNWAGEVYYMDCNGGDHQKWNYLSDGKVQNVATGRYLTASGPTGHHTWDFSVFTTTETFWLHNKWEFYGG